VAIRRTRLFEQAHADGRPDIGYAMIFPGMTILKILFVDIVPAFFRNGNNILAEAGKHDPSAIASLTLYTHENS
jgi:hypothetical protein